MVFSMKIAQRAIMYSFRWYYTFDVFNQIIYFVFLVALVVVVAVVVPNKEKSLSKEWISKINHLRYTFKTPRNFSIWNDFIIWTTIDPVEMKFSSIRLNMAIGVVKFVLDFDLVIAWFG